MFVFLRRYWSRRCAGCLHEIGQGEYYLRAWDQLYHYDCYKCCVCSRKMNTGEEIHLTQDNRFMCKEDFLNHSKTFCKNLSGKKPLEKKQKELLFVSFPLKMILMMKLVNLRQF